MDQQYNQIHQQADRLHHRAEAQIDDHNHPQAPALIDDARQVLEVIESRKAPRSIEDAVKRVQAGLQRMKDQETGCMSPSDAGTLYNDYEDLRREVRQLPSY